VRGQTAGGRAVVRFRELSGDRLALAAADARGADLALSLTAIHDAFEASPVPAWSRSRDGRLDWVNAAYPQSVEGRGAADAVRRGLELLDSPSRVAVAVAHAAAQAFRRRVSTVVAGHRRFYDVVDVLSKGTAAGFAIDGTRIEEAEAALRRSI